MSGSELFDSPRGIEIHMLVGEEHHQEAVGAAKAQRPETETLRRQKVDERDSITHCYDVSIRVHWSL